MAARREEAPAAGTSRRERLRAELIRDAVAAARDIASGQGLEALTLAAVARRLGVSPPALYRYFDGRDGLVRALYDDLTADLNAAVDEAVGGQPPDDVQAQLQAATRAVLTWSLTHHGAFALLMGPTYPAMAASKGEIPHALTRELGRRFADLFEVLWRRGGLTYRADEAFDPDFRRQLATYRDAFRPDLPLGVVSLMLTCWRQIYGLVSMAANQHLGFAFGSDGYQALFDDMMADLFALLGLRPGWGDAAGTAR